MTTNYVLAAFMGDRQNPAPGYDQDRTTLLKTHLESLERLEHSLAQITVVVSGNPGPIGETFLRDLPSHLKTSTLVVQRRPNVGMSYGAFSEAFEKWGSDFSHFIFTEDDYHFTQPNFDRWLVDELELRPLCGFLCGAAYQVDKDTAPHAAVFVGMATSEALTDAACNGKLYYDRTREVPASGFLGQKGMSKAIINAGWTIDDWLCTWSTAYWDSVPGIVRWFSRDEYGQNPQGKGNLLRPSFVIPAQASGAEVKLSDGSAWHRGTISRAGEFSGQLA